MEKKQIISSIVIGVLVGVLLFLLIFVVIVKNQDFESTGNDEDSDSNSGSKSLSSTKDADEEECKTVTVEYEEETPYTDEDCYDKSLSYHSEWVGIGHNGDTVTATISLLNTDEKSGKFKVTVYFYNTEDYPYETTKDLVSLDDASIKESEEKYIGSQQTEEFEISVEREKEGVFNRHEYWATYLVTAPEAEFCETVIKYKTETKTRTEEQCE